MEFVLWLLSSFKDVLFPVFDDELKRNGMAMVKKKIKSAMNRENKLIKAQKKIKKKKLVQAPIITARKKV